MALKRERDFARHPHLFELIDKDGDVCARSHCGLTLAIAARDLLPDQEQDPDRTGKGWDIQVVSS